MKKQLGAVERLYPMPCVLVVGGTLEAADVLTVAWINIVSSTPPTVAMGLRKTRGTLELIRAERSFTVNVPGTELAAEVDYCGITSGKTTDKFEATGLTLRRAEAVVTPVIDECPYNLECKVTGEVEVGEYVVVLGEVVESHAEESILDAEGKLVDVDLLDPIAYIAGTREYRRIGSKVADAYSIGKTIG